jgi:DNA-directed RNA polymerase specialized sigma24 family protein
MYEAWPWTAGNGLRTKGDRQRPGQGRRADAERAGQPVQAGRVRRALAQLSPAQRAVLQEVYYRRRSATEVAAAFDMPVVAVKSCLQQALHALREHLADAIGGEGVVQP